MESILSLLFTLDHFCIETNVTKVIPKSLKVVFVAVLVSAVQNTIMQLLDYALCNWRVAEHLTTSIIVQRSVSYSAEGLLLEAVCIWPVQIAIAFFVSMASNYMGRPLPIELLVLLAPLSYLLACVLWLPLTIAFMWGFYGDIYPALLVTVSSTLASLIWVRYYRTVQFD